MIPLAGEDSQQLQATRNGRYMYAGGFAKQPIRSLTGAQLIHNVRSLYLDMKKKTFKHENMTPLQVDLFGMVSDGNS